jgi:hypothetical protein
VWKKGIISLPWRITSEPTSPKGLEKCATRRPDVQILAAAGGEFFGCGVLISCAWSAMLNQRSRLRAGTMEDLSCNGQRPLLKKFV